MKEYEKNYESKNLISEDDKQPFFMYLVYLLRKEGLADEIKTSHQFVSRARTLTQKYSNVQDVMQIMGRQSSYDTFFDSFDYFLDLKSKELKESIEKMIDIYLIRIKAINDDIENLDKELLNETYGDCLVSTVFPKRFLYKEKEKLGRVYFDFFDPTVNLMEDILFELNSIKHTRIDFATFEMKKALKFDSIIFMPPYNKPGALMNILKIDRIENPTNVSFEAIRMSSLLRHLSESGRMVAFTANGILNKVTDIDYRKSFIKNKNIRYIIELPKIDVMPPSLTLISLSNGNETPYLINARKFAQNLRRKVNLDSQKILRAVSGQIEGASYELTENYLVKYNYDFSAERFIDRLNQTSYYHTAKLKDVVKKIYRGFQIPSEMSDEYLSDTKTKVKLLTLTDVEDGYVNPDTLQSMKGIDKKMEHYIMEDKDLVISCKGKTFKTAVVRVPYNETYIFTGSLIVVRCNQELLNPVYLKMFFDSDEGTELLRRIQTGAKTLSLNPNSMQDLDIPLPTIEKQMTLSLSYESKLKEIKELKEYVDSLKEGFDRRFNKNFLKLLD